MALRVPAHPLALALLAGLGKALVAPSANRYMAVSPTSAVHVARQFPGEDLLILVETAQVVLLGKGAR